MTDLSGGDNQIQDQWAVLAGQEDIVLLDGFHAVKHALRFGASIPMIVTQDKAQLRDLASRLAPDILASLETRAMEISKSALVSLVSRPSPTGVAALAIRPRQFDAGSVRHAPIVLLDNPRHLGNVGAAIRVAAGFGASGVLTTGDADPWNPQAIRGSAGLHFALRVQRIELSELREARIFAFDAAGDDLPTVRIPADAVMAFGSERRGISEEVRMHAERLVSIPMQPKVSSYNLATSVAIALYHWSFSQRLGDVSRLLDH